jgi:hypothetical protein
MGKRKRNVVTRGESSEVSASSGPRIQKTYLERLIGRSDSMYALGSELVRRLKDRNAPVDIISKAEAYIPVLEQFRELFFGLRDSGWVPVQRGSRQEFVEGARVGILKDQIERYSFIPGLAEGTVRLVADRLFERGTTHKYVEVLVKDAETGAVYGLIPKRHLGAI